MNAILIDHLTKRYGDFTAVDDLNLTIQQGELFSLLGINGAGKTTAIKMMTGLIKPTAGDATLLGASIKTDPQAVKKNLNISPQETAVAANLSVMENLLLTAGIYGQNIAQAKASAENMASQFDLQGVKHKKAKHLSGGTQRRLSIAMALISDPKILFLDEPTLGLDVIARRELWTSIQALKGTVTMVLTTHYLEEVEALSDRVGVMIKGKLVAVGTVNELKKQTGTSSLEEAFVSIAGGQK